VSNVAVLEREVYSEAEAARLLRLSQSTLHYWLEGGRQGGVPRRPVIRPEPTGIRALTWGEFVEAGMLSQYRNLKIPMPQLREFIGYLRTALGVPYPLAHDQPLVARGRGLVREAQEHAEVPPEYWLVVPAGEQGMLSYAGQNFLDRVRWEAGTAAAYRPHDDARSTVMVNPLVRFGKPAVGGISTAVIAEQSDSGATRDEIADDFGLPRQDVAWALAYEATRAA